VLVPGGGAGELGWSALFEMMSDEFSRIIQGLLAGTCTAADINIDEDEGKDSSCNGPEAIDTGGIATTDTPLHPSIRTHASKTSNTASSDIQRQDTADSAPVDDLLPLARLMSQQIYERAVQDLELRRRGHVAVAVRRLHHLSFVCTCVSTSYAQPCLWLLRNSGSDYGGGGGGWIGDASPDTRPSTITRPSTEYSLSEYTYSSHPRKVMRKWLEWRDVGIGGGPRGEREVRDGAGMPCLSRLRIGLILTPVHM